MHLFKNKFKDLYLKEKAKHNIPFSEFCFKNNLKIKTTFDKDIMARDLKNIHRFLNERLLNLVPPFKLTIIIDEIEEETKND